MSAVDVIAVMKRDASDAVGTRAGRYMLAHCIHLEEQSNEARVAVIELIAERDKLREILARPAHAHLEGAHLSTPASDCILCDVIAQREQGASA
jgi:hypothetical protein